MNFIFLIDPMETIHIEKDTNFSFMHESYKRSHNVYYLQRHGIFYRNGKVCFAVRQVAPRLRHNHPFQLLENRVLNEDEADAVFLKTDPPFGDIYLANSWFLNFLPPDYPLINRPQGIRAVSEKIWIFQFKDLIPETLICTDKKEATLFLEKHKEIILKPTDNYGSNTVFKLKKGDANANVIFELLSKNGKKPVIIQPYIQTEESHKRILLLNGEPLGAMLRVSPDQKSSEAVNVYAPEKITEKDRRIIASIKKDLLNLGLYFIVIDTLGDYLVEIGLASQGFLHQLSQFQQKNLTLPVIRFAEKLAEDYNKRTLKEIPSGKSA